MSPSGESAGNLILREPRAEMAVADSAAPIFCIVLGTVAMTVLELNALAYW